MHPQLIVLGLALGLAPAPPGGPAAADGAYAVLRSAPPAPRAGCRVARAQGGELRAPLYSPDTATCPVARVASEEIALDELAAALATSHGAKGSKAGRGETTKGMDFAPTLERLIDVRLLVLEAKEMGLQELPDNRQAMEAFRASTLRTMLQTQASAATRPDPAEVDRLFKAAVKEWKLRSVMFEKEEDAAAFRKAVGKGGSFDALAKAAVADKKAQGGEPGFLPPRQLVPELAQAAGALKQGQLSPPVKLATGWVVLKLEGVRYPENATALEQARAQSLGERQHQAVRRFHEALVKKYATVDKKLLEQLDFEVGGEAGFQALAKDERVLVQIRGEPPITVAALAGEMSKKYFHGIAEPIKEHRLNPFKKDAFDLVVGARLFAREARERKLEESVGFKRRVEEYDRVLAFNTFLERVVLPGVKVSEDEVQARYEQRKALFSTPQLYRLDGLGFVGAKPAQAALDKLQGGTDLEWLRANGEGQLKPQDQKLRLEGALLSATTMPASLAKALTGARPGDYRLYATDDGAQHYVLRVADQVPPGVKPYADAREQLAREVQAEKVATAVKDYADRLRQVQAIDVLITRIVG
jgi:hypothetical protein